MSPARDQDPRSQPRLDAAVLIATGLGFGFSPVAPGTVGTLWGLPLAWAIVRIPAAGPIPAACIQALVILMICAAGVPLCTVAAQRLGGEKDPGAIVFDEFATLPVTFFLVPWQQFNGGGLALVVALGFALHRLFDISKPPPCRQAERLSAGLGIMADDCVAGVYSCAVLHACLWLGQLI